MAALVLLVAAFARVVLVVGGTGAAAFVLEDDRVAVFDFSAMRVKSRI